MKALKKFFKKVMEILHIISSDYDQTKDKSKLPQEKLPDHQMWTDEDEALDILSSVHWMTKETA